MKEFLDEVGGKYIVQKVKQMINDVETDSVTKQELQAKLDALDINIDLSAYATKEELTNALSNIDLSAYATKEYVTDAINNAQLSGDGSSVDLSIYAKKSDLDSKANTNHTHTMSDITDYTAPDLSSYAKKTDIPSLSGYATKTYVDQNKFSGSYNDLTNKPTIPSIDGLATTEYVDNAIANVPSGGGNVDLSNYYTKNETYSKTEVDTAIENAIYGSYTFDPNFDFSGKTLYFDTTKNLASMLPKEQYILYISDTSSTGYNYGQAIAWNEFSNSPKGRLTLVMSIDGSNGIANNIILYDLNCSDGEKSQMGTFNNHWATSSYTFSSKFKTPVYGDFGDKSRSIFGEELFNAFMSCVTRVVDADGNEVSFKILNKPEEIISPTVSITETDNGHTISITDVNGTQSFDMTDGVSPTVTVTKEGKIATITCTDVNGTTTATISDGADGSSGGSSGGASNVYSTEETAIGTWIDGKTIYRKVIEVGKLSSVSESGGHGKAIVDFENPFGMVIKMTALLVSGNTHLIVDSTNQQAILLPSTSTSTYVKQVEDCKAYLMSPTNKSIQLWYGKDYGGYNCTFIVEYTKSA